MNSVMTVPREEMTMTTTVDLDELDRVVAGAWRAPWVAHTFEIECPCPNGDDCGDTHSCEEIRAPDEYPGIAEGYDPPGQCVAQISVPGLEDFAARNARAIVAMRNAFPALLAECRALRAVRDAAASLASPAPAAPVTVDASGTSAVNSAEHAPDHGTRHSFDNGGMWTFLCAEDETMEAECWVRGEWAKAGVPRLTVEGGAFVLYPYVIGAALHLRPAEAFAAFFLKVTRTPGPGFVIFRLEKHGEHVIEVRNPILRRKNVYVKMASAAVSEAAPTAPSDAELVKAYGQAVADAADGPGLLATVGNAQEALLARMAELRASRDAAENRAADAEVNVSTLGEYALRAAHEIGIYRSASVAAADDLRASTRALAAAADVALRIAATPGETATCGVVGEETGEGHWMQKLIPLLQWAADMGFQMQEMARDFDDAEEYLATMPPNPYAQPEPDLSMKWEAAIRKALR